MCLISLNLQDPLWGTCNFYHYFVDAIKRHSVVIDFPKVGMTLLWVPIVIFPALLKVPQCEPNAHLQTCTHHLPHVYTLPAYTTHSIPIHITQIPQTQHTYKPHMHTHHIISHINTTHTIHTHKPTHIPCTSHLLINTATTQSHSTLHTPHTYHIQPHTSATCNIPINPWTIHTTHPPINTTSHTHPSTKHPHHTTDASYTT